ncbi:hypothetical protein AAHE18_05G251700 [Arachis hypogaea]
MMFMVLILLSTFYNVLRSYVSLSPLEDLGMLQRQRFHRKSNRTAVGYDHFLARHVLVIHEDFEKNGGNEF